MVIYPQKELPEYYPTMYLDGYTPEEIWVAHHNTMLKRLKESQEEESESNIHIKSEIKVK